MVIIFLAKKYLMNLKLRLISGIIHFNISRMWFKQNHKVNIQIPLKDKAALQRLYLLTLLERQTKPP